MELIVGWVAYSICIFLSISNNSVSNGKYHQMKPSIHTIVACITAMMVVFHIIICLRYKISVLTRLTSIHWVVLKSQNNYGSNFLSSIAFGNNVRRETIHTFLVPTFQWMQFHRKWISTNYMKGKPSSSYLCHCKSLYKQLIVFHSSLRFIHCEIICLGIHSRSALFFFQCLSILSVLSVFIPNLV